MSREYSILEGSNIRRGVQVKQTRRLWDRNLARWINIRRRIQGRQKTWKRLLQMALRMCLQWRLEGQYDMVDSNLKSGFLQITIHGVGKYDWPDGRVWYSKYCSLILGVGLKIKCTVEGNIYGKMESVMMESTRDDLSNFSFSIAFRIKEFQVDLSMLQNDKKCGFGIFYWPDGKQFQGQWFNGRQHGKGLMIGKDGKKKIGSWLEGKLVSSTEDENFQIMPEGWILQQQ